MAKKLKNNTGGNTQTVQAPGQFYGYSVQVTLVLAHLLRCHEGDVVSLEVIDDVAVEGSTGTTAVQSKSGLAHNPISDRSKGLWKTLFNWVVAIRSGALDQGAHCILYAVQPHKGKLADRLHRADLDSAESLVHKVRNEFWGPAPDRPKREKLRKNIAQYVNEVLGADDDILINLVARLKIERGSGSPTDDLRPALREKAIRPDAVEDVLKYLLGWAKMQLDTLIESGQPAVIKWSDFHDELTSAMIRYDRSNTLTSAGFSITDGQIQTELTNRVYVRQLELVKAEEEERVQAVNDYLRASADRTSWAERGVVIKESFDEYNEDLERRWANKRRLVEVELSTKNDVQRGQALLYRCLEIHLRLQGEDVPNYFTPGSYHALADELTVGWHPSFESLVELPQSGDGDAAANETEPTGESS